MPQRPSLTRLRLGTRGSKLARAQAVAVMRALKSVCSIDTDLVVVRTSGDQFQDRPLAEIGGKGLFIKELEEALLAGEIDLAVHSMKDVPVELPAGLAIGAVLARADPRDAFLSPVAPMLEALPRGASVGTGSMRRRAQIARARPDLACIALRGNVDTRLRKLDRGEFDAILLAQAGLSRLGLAGRATAILSADAWLPALAQGALGIEIRAQDDLVGACITKLDHEPTAVALACERAFQAALDGSCRTPIAGLATVVQEHLAFRGEVLAPDGSDFVEARFEINLGKEPRNAAAHAGGEAGLALKPRAQPWLAL